MIVDLALLERNITEMAALVYEAQVALRPHANTHKTPQIAAMQLNAGAVGLTCAKVDFAPPFRIHWVYTDVEPESRLREVVTGDLTGVRETLFREDPMGKGTHVTFNWYVRLTNPALNLLGYVAERLPPQSRQRYEGGRKRAARLL